LRLTLAGPARPAPQHVSTPDHPSSLRALRTKATLSSPTVTVLTSRVRPGGGPGHVHDPSVASPPPRRDGPCGAPRSAGCPAGASSP